MKKLIVMIVVPLCLAFTLCTVGVIAQETVANIEKYVKDINGGKNCDGSQAKYLCEYYKIDTRDPQGNPRWDCRSRAGLAAQMLKDNGYEFHRMFSEGANGEPHVYLEVKDEAGRWWPILNVWSIDKAN